MQDQSAVRTLLLEQLTGKNAHVDFERSVQGLSQGDVSNRPEGMPYSIWELVEHIRLAQRDILEFSRDPDYTSPDWPEGYWPGSKAPETSEAWERSLSAIKKDHQEMVNLIRDSEIDLLAPLSHGDGQTLFREAMLIVDHNAYHIGQIVLIRKVLGNW